MNGSWKQQTAGAIGGCILLVFFGLCANLPVALPVYTQPSIRGLNPNVQVQLPPLPSDSSSSAGTSSPSKGASKAKQGPSVFPTDLDHFTLYLEHQLCTYAATGISQIGRLITWAVNHC